MSKGDKRRPGTGYAEGFDRIFRRPPEKLTPEDEKWREKAAQEFSKAFKENLRDKTKF
jgi:hypothetical protein